MRKGLTSTLMTIAIALIGYHATAMAPVVADLPTPIIGDENSVTDPNLFVYNTTHPNHVINLNNYVTDDGPISNITWSFFEADGTYQINAKDSVDVSDEANLVTPGAAAIAGPGVTDTDPDDPDGNPRTIVIRNADYSPIGGPNLDPPVAEGLFDGKVVTLFASDGTTVGQNSMMVWTDASGIDRLSGVDITPPPPYERVLELDFTTGSTFGWSSSLEFGTGTRTVSGGLCLAVPAAGDNSLEWFSKYAEVDMVANAVWRVRMSVSTSQGNAALVPLVRVLFDNAASPAEQGQGIFGANGFFGEYYFFSNVGGANAVGAGNPVLEIWMNHAAVQTARWTSEGLAPAVDDFNDIRLRFNAFDIAALDGGNQVGQVCLQDVTVDRFDIADAQVLSTVFDKTVNQTDYAISFTAGQTTLTAAADGVTFAPASAGGWTNEVILVVPSGGTLATQYPITWEADTLYMVTADMSAPTAADTDLPHDLIILGMDTPTQELIGLNGVTPNLTGGLPTTGDPQTYTSFFHSHNLTDAASVDADFGRLRPRLGLLSSTTFSPGGNATNTDRTKVHNMKVMKVTFE